MSSHNHPDTGTARNEVETKNSKTSVTFFFPVDLSIRGIVSDWISDPFTPTVRPRPTSP
jgi:hypothetical protein